MSDIKRKRTAIVVGAIVIVAVALIIAVAVLTNGNRGGQPMASPTTTSATTTTSSTPSATESSTTTSPSTSTTPTSATPTHTDTVAKQGLRDVQSTCGSGESFSEDPTKESLVLEQDGESLTLLTGVQSDKQLFNCVVRETGMPQDVQDKIAQADRNGGLQEAEWGNIKATWTFNPNSGLDLYLEPQS